ncbi:MAG: ATP-binding protein [Nostocaceae cyanobacterium]|nr:ATP-binding protein [Nostocaceae cyanobacterium]
MVIAIEETTVHQPLRVLLLQDSEHDAEGLIRQLQGSYQLYSKRVETLTALQVALRQKSWDIVIADEDSQQLTYSQALQVLRTAALDLPVIVVSSENGVERVIRALKAGARDVVPKANLARLKESINRELREAELWRQQGLIEAEKQALQAKYQGLFENAVVGIFQTTPDGHYLNANPALAKIYGYESTAEMMANITDIEQQLYVQPHRRREFTEIMQLNDSASDFESQIYRQDGKIIWIVENARAVRDKWGNLLYYEGFVEDVTERHRVHEELEVRVHRRTGQLRRANEQLQREISERQKAQAILAAHNQILELMLGGTALPGLLEAIARVVEDLLNPVFQDGVLEEIKCCFLLLDPKDNKLYHGAAPSLPEEYKQAINGIITEPGVGCCGTAAYRREAVIVEDIAKDPLWKDYRDLALKFGLRACWSVPILTKDGSVLGTFSMYYSQARSPNEYEKELIIKAVHLATIAMERDRTQVELQQFQTRLESLSSNIPGGIYQFLLKPNGAFSIPFVSSSCDQIYEVATAVEQQNPELLLEIIHGCDRSQFDSSLAHSAETLSPWEWEGRINSLSGKVKWIKGAARPQKLSNGDILWDGVLMDITESKHIQAALEQSEAQLRQQAHELETALYELQKTQMQLIQTEKMSFLGQLVAGIAHEINNPVNFISNNLHFVCEYTQDLFYLLDIYQQCYPHPTAQIQAESLAVDLDFIKEDLPKILSSMKVGTDRIGEIILSLRNFSRGDQTTAQFADIHKLLDSTILILQPRLKSKSRKTKIKIIRKYGNLPLVKCYPGQLNQVFTNLIANAIDAIEESLSKEQIVNHQGWLKICTELSADNTHVMIRIIDNGVGISPQNQQEIFKSFFTTKPLGKGTGLGLSISHNIIVEKHAGELHCFSELGKETEFLIKLPIELMGNG